MHKVHKNAIICYDLFAVFTKQTICLNRWNSANGTSKKSGKRYCIDKTKFKVVQNGKRAAIDSALPTVANLA